MMDNIPNLRLEVLIDYVLTKRNVYPILKSLDTILGTWYNTLLMTHGTNPFNILIVGI